ncbi:hypothetical protein EYF80_064982 [Liparis tanakae]|uniref:Uncharacterized protein n=1 Tax=Liparis tanakae TaxID=230148 RepID=A0A4Z2E982_9TELE|nr:hypothetical protein EYF80_064982 [Liparis tanakae]
MSNSPQTQRSSFPSLSCRPLGCTSMSNSPQTQRSNFPSLSCRPPSAWGFGPPTQRLWLEAGLPGFQVLQVRRRRSVIATGNS